MTCPANKVERYCGDARRIPLESVFSFVSDLLLVCWNKSLPFPQVEFISYLRVLELYSMTPKGLSTFDFL